MKIILIFIFLLTLSCGNNKVVKSHGFFALEEKSNKIELLKSNKNDVIEIIGKPSTISLFNDNTWYFIQRETVNQSVFKLGKSKIIKNNILLVSFNDYGVVNFKKLYNIDDMNMIKIDKNETVKDFETRSKIGKVLKSLEQKINAPKSKTNN